METTRRSRCSPSAPEPALHSERSPCSEKPVHRNWRVAPSPCNQRKACPAMMTQYSQKEVELVKKQTKNSAETYSPEPSSLKSRWQRLPWWSSDKDSELPTSEEALGLIPDQGARSHMPQLRPSTVKQQINKDF